MDTVDLHPLLEHLEGNIDDLEEALAPLLNAPLSDVASKLPLLDKAKLHVMSTYAIESILFSYLLLNGENAKEHAVFTELTRLRQYFEKIKKAEAGPLKRDLSLDKQAAGRFIKHALLGNERYDLERSERQAREGANAHIKFDELSERIKQEEISKKRKASAVEGLAGDEEDESSSEGSRDSESPSALDKGVEANAPWRKGKSSKRTKKERREKKKEIEKGKGNKKSNKQRKLEVEPRNLAQDQRAGPLPPRRPKSNLPPRGHSAAFQALLKGPLPKKESDSRKTANRDTNTNG